jgi:hypothetical protein
MSNLQNTALWMKRMLGRSGLSRALAAGVAIAAALAPAIAAAQNAEIASALETGLAGSTAARVESPWCAAGNAATLAHTASASLLACCRPSSIGIEGYYEAALAAAMPIDSATALGATASALGVKGYREVVLGVTAARRVSGMMALGATLALHSVAIDGYGAALAPTLDVGGIARLSDAIRFGATATNILRGRLGESDLPQRIALGFAFDLARGTIVSLDVVQELRRRASVRLGVSATPASGFTLRAGAANAPGTIALGAGYDAGGIVLDIATAYVQPLGLTHAVGIGLRW